MGMEEIHVSDYVTPGKKVNPEATIFRKLLKIKGKSNILVRQLSLPTKGTGAWSQLREEIVRTRNIVNSKKRIIK